MDWKYSPFTADDDVWYGYFQMTSPEVARDRSEDIFHVWISKYQMVQNSPEKTVNGTVHKPLFYWTFKDEELSDVCHLGGYPRCYETR